jgi:serine/threonine-protein kinase RsbW
MPVIEGREQLEVVADLNNLATVRKFVERITTDAGLDRESVDGLVLAVDEAVANIIQYGYQKDGSSPIEVDAVRADGSLALHIRDRAPLYNPLEETAAPELGTPLEERPLGGMGVYLIRQNTDRVEYHAREGGGNELVLVKNLPA